MVGFGCVGVGVDCVCVLYFVVMLMLVGMCCWWCFSVFISSVGYERKLVLRN